MKKSDFLPIGSVIITADSSQKLIIVGKCIKSEDKWYDYGCVKYPYGFIKEKGLICINKEDIKGLCFLGDVNRKRGD